jgi:hypothetical protein
MTFNPECFLGLNPECNPHSLSFFFGQCICPGRIIVDSNIHLTIAQSLAAFDIGKVIRDGQEVPIKPHFMPRVISHPAPFEVRIRLRDARYEVMIRSVEQEHPWQKSHAEILRGMAK